MAQSVQELQKLINEYEKILGIGEHDPMRNAFIVYVKILNQQSEFLKDFKIKEAITKVDKDSPEYKRAMDMVDGLPKMITAVNDLKSLLKLTKEDLVSMKPNNPVYAKITTAESIADSIGELAGQQSK